MASSDLTVVSIAGERVELPDLLSQLAAALAGTGPAIAPVPADSAETDLLPQVLRPDLALEDASTAVVLPSSGSTGAPKGVLLSADALRASAEATLQRLGGPGAWLLALPVTRIAGLQVVVRSLIGAPDHPPVALDGKVDPAGFVAATRRLGSDRRYTALVPTQLARLLDAGGEAIDALASYDAVLLGGAATPPDLLARCRNAGVRVRRTYGMTETSGGCVYDGLPLTGVQVELDAENRICLGGPTLFSGYRLRPDLTAEALVHGWHRTSDLGRLHDDGRLEVLGRVDDVVVSGGVNVPLLAVERALSTLPGLREVAAVGVPDPEWGERVIAHVVVRRDASAPSLQLARDHVAAQHPRAYAPRDLVIWPELPLLPSGKLDREALRAWCTMDG